MIAIVDYGMGNVRSVYNALDFLGEEAVITSDPDALGRADRLILPGVGAFGDAMRQLQERGLIEVLAREVIQRSKPFLGVCLGMQLLARCSTEHGVHAGLGWFDAHVRRFEFAGEKLKVPHVGWNDVTPTTCHPLFAGLKPGQFCFYFVHSFHVECDTASAIAATCDYGHTFCAAIYRDNVFATQFHPEKSQDNGLQMLRNFASWTP
jgi:glutamine amidotransferase